MEFMGNDGTVYEVVEGEFMGAPPTIRVKATGQALTRQPLPQAPLPRPTANVQANRIKTYCGIGNFVWTAANTGAIAEFEVEPQREFTPSRVVIDVVPSAAGVGGTVDVESITVGDLPQSPDASQTAPAAMFRPDATESEIAFQTIGKGCKFILKLTHSVAVAGADTLSVSCGMYGWMVR